MSDAYDMIDRFLRNNLGDDDYAEYSEALESLCSAQPAQAAPITSETGNQADQGASAITSGAVPVLTEREIEDMYDAVKGKGWSLDFARAIEQAVRAKLGVAPQWLPIDTAPKDGNVLFYSGGNPWIGMWGDYCKYNHPKITHWMHLSSPPGIVGKEGGNV